MSWDAEVTSLSPTFRWTFNGVTTESVLSHPTGVSGTPAYAASLIPNEPTLQSLDFNTLDLTPSNDNRINGGGGTGTYAWTQRTIAFWLRIDNTLLDYTFFEEGGGTNWWALHFRSGNLQLVIGEDNAPRGFVETPLSQDTDYFICATVDLSLPSNQMKLYVDGQLVGEVTTTVGTDLAEHTGDISIGGVTDAPDRLNSTSGFSNFDGKMQELLYWYQTALVQSELEDLFVAGGGTIPPPTFLNNSAKQVLEGVSLTSPLIAERTDSFSIVGGADQAEFEINSNNLRWVGNGTRSFSSPADANTDNIYEVTIRATGPGGTTDQNVTVEVLEFTVSTGVYRGKWTGGAVASFTPSLNVWSALANAGVGSTEIDNGDASFTWTPTTGRLRVETNTPPNGYLIIAGYHWRCTHNNRATLQGRWIQTAGSSVFVSTSTSGYARNNSNDEVYVRTIAFVHSPTGGGFDEFELQWRRSAGAGSVAGGLISTDIQIIPLWYNNIGMYTSSSTTSPGGTTPAAVTGFGTVIESDASSIALASDTVTLSGDNTRYLILGGQYWEGTGGRTQRWHGLTLNGSWLNDVQGYSYSRDGNNDDIGEFFMLLHETGTNNDTIQSATYRGASLISGGGADIAGTTSTSGAASHMLVVLELDSATEVFKSTTTSINDGGITTNGNAMTIGDSILLNDTSFSSDSSTELDATVGGETLLLGTVSGAYQTSTGTRYTGTTRFTIDGALQSDSESGDYGRGDQGTQDTWGWGSSMAAAYNLTAGQNIGIALTRTGDNGSVDANAGWVQFVGINLETMVPSTPPASPGIYIGPQTADTIEIGPGTFDAKYLGNL